MDTSTIPQDDPDDSLTVADIYASMGKNPDPTGDYAAGRTRVFLSGEEFIADLRSQPYERG